MRDCTNIEMRERLPELIHGKLNDSERIEVEAHLAGCEDCTAEMELMRGIISSQKLYTSSIDDAHISDIVSALPPYRSEKTGRPRSGKWLGNLSIAAGLLIAAVGVATITLNDSSIIKPKDSAPMLVQEAGVSGDLAGEENNEGAGLSLIALGDLSDEELRGLIDLMESIDVLPTEIPEPLIFDPVMFSDAAQWEDL